MIERPKEQIAVRVSKINIAGNILLAAFKLFAGIVSHSAAMCSDAVHSLADVFSAVAVIVGVKMAGREEDKCHPYGHERMECVAAIVLSVVLGVTGLGLGYTGVQTIAAGEYHAIALPGVLALVTAAVCVAAKEGMYHYTRAAAKKIDSGALMADAWHHRADALASLGTFVGILGARLGLPILDPLASVMICVLIVKAALGIFLDAIGKMTDKACADAVVEEMREVVLAQESVVGVSQIRTRLFGGRIYADVEIQADGAATLYETHEIARGVQEALEARFPKVKRCMVHVHPARTDGEN